MRTNLVPEDPLSEVAFVHDYVQVAFQDARFSLYNTLRLILGPIAFTQGEVEFPGHLVGLIGHRVLSASSSENAFLQLHFEGGAELQVLRAGRFRRGPEAYQFNGLQGLIVVEQNE